MRQHLLEKCNFYPLQHQNYHLIIIYSKMHFDSPFCKRQYIFFAVKNVIRNDATYSYPSFTSHNIPIGIMSRRFEIDASVYIHISFFIYTLRIFQEVTICTFRAIADGSTTKYSGESQILKGQETVKSIQHKKLDTRENALYVKNAPTCLYFNAILEISISADNMIPIYDSQVCLQS